MSLSLMERWAKIEPNRCGHEGSEYILIGQLDHGLPLLQSALQEAIENHKIGCILHRSGISDDWEAKIGAFSAFDKKPAIALLTAYVQWLEKNQEVRS